jgi:hypothetical protein
MRWVLWFFGHFNAKTPTQNAPFLALFAKNAKTKSTNYININTLHFCILQFAKNGGAD